MTYGSLACPDVVKKLVGRPDGTVYYAQVFDLQNSGALVITEWPADRMVDAAGPAGRAVDAADKKCPLPDNASKGYLVLNAPAPVSLIRR